MVPPACIDSWVISPHPPNSSLKLCSVSIGSDRYILTQQHEFFPAPLYSGIATCASTAFAGSVVSQGGLLQRKKRCSTPHGSVSREREYYTTNRHAELSISVDPSVQWNSFCFWQKPSQSWANHNGRPWRPRATEYVDTLPRSSI